MKFSEYWLREWIDPPVSSAALGDQLTMSGLEIDAIEPAAADFSGVVVGQVTAIEAHPQADRLQVCRVEVGQAEPLQIVCGAKNVVTGMKVPTALTGALLPGGLKIRPTKLRGEASHGMLCSAQELGIAEQADGLLPLDADAPVGMDIRAYLDLDDQCFEIGLTPNRGDCLSITGIAREVGTLNRMPVTPPELATIDEDIETRVAVHIDAEKACPRYVGRVISGLDPEAVTPIWMQERLRRSGLRSLGPVVDVTNYCLLEMGQPMHAFDLSQIEGGIRVAYAARGSKMRLLDDREIAIEDDDTLVITDDAGDLALAGVMGGARAAVSSDTRAIFLEAAHFTPAAVAGKARKFGMHTDSSHRFERGVDPSLPRRAIDRATALLLSIAGGQAGPVTEACSDDVDASPEPITLRLSQTCKLLGMEVTAAEVEDILTRLGCIVEGTDEKDVWSVSVPAYRFDLDIEADLIEEVARIKGYENLPDNRPLIHAGIPPLPDAQDVFLADTRAAMAQRGYAEVICYSFVSEAQQKMFDPDKEPLTLTNPLAADLEVMRTSLWPGIIDVARHNQRRQQNRIRIFEIGKRFFRDEAGGHQESVAVSGLVSGPVFPVQWAEQTRLADYFDLKGDLEAVFPGLAFRKDEHHALHPGRSARVADADGREIGWIGALHPGLQRELGLDNETIIFEFSTDELISSDVVSFTPISRFPSVRRDLALLVPEAVSAEMIRHSVIAAAGSLLSSFDLFDVYQGKGIDSGLKSIAIGLTFQDFSSTLTDDEIESCMRDVLDRLNVEHHARLREE